MTMFYLYDDRVVTYTTNAVSLDDLSALKLCGLGKPDKKSFESMVPRNVKVWNWPILHRNHIYNLVCYVSIYRVISLHLIFLLHHILFRSALIGTHLSVWLLSKFYVSASINWHYIAFVLLNMPLHPHSLDSLGLTLLLISYCWTALVLMAFEDVVFPCMLVFLHHSFTSLYFLFFPFFHFFNHFLHCRS